MRTVRGVKDYDFSIGEFRMTYPIKQDGKKAYPNELDFISDIIQAVKQEGNVDRVEMSFDLYNHLNCISSKWLNMVFKMHYSGEFFFEFFPKWKFDLKGHRQLHNLPNQQNPCT
jgi:hypothetical protein